MGEDRTARLGLPLLAPGQAQKEMTHNEALALIDVALQASVVAVGVDTPPGAPIDGRCWVVGDTPSGDWTGQARAVAGWTAGGWRFVAPRAGMSVWSEADAMWARFDGTDWTTGEIRGDSLVLGNESLLAAPADPIADPAGGATVDAEARATLGAILAVLRHHRLVLAP